MVVQGRLYKEDNPEVLQIRHIFTDGYAPFPLCWVRVIGEWRQVYADVL